PRHRPAASGRGQGAAHGLEHRALDRTAPAGRGHPERNPLLLRPLLCPRRLGRPHRGRDRARTPLLRRGGSRVGLRNAVPSGEVRGCRPGDLRAVREGGGGVIVIPAIDLRGGRCVRLFRGDPTAETVYDADPVAVARGFEAEGARRLHVVDLDAALGSGSNRDVVVAICRNVAVPVQLGGGLRSVESADRALADGAARAILDPGLVTETVRRFGDRIAVAVDVRAGRLALHGWRHHGPRVEEAVRALADAGAPRLVVTAVQRDGTMDGPDLALYERILSLTDLPVIASGGVRKAEDVHALRDLGLEAVVVGKALYAGTLRLSEVVRG